MTKKIEDSITWLQVNNWVPIIITLIGATVAFGALISKNDLTNQKLDFLIETVRTNYAQVNANTNDIRAAELDIKEIKTILESR